MIIQKILKGINGLEYEDARHVVYNGIISNWWRKVGSIRPAESLLHLTKQNANLHLNHYNDPVPTANPLFALGARTFGEVSPFISTTAGTIHRDPDTKRNILFDPFLTALRFATKNFRSSGYIFYAYVFTIGKVAIELEQFAEEVRELHIYREYLPYHSQGEVMAKVIIPSVQIEKAEEYYGPTAKLSLKAAKIPSPVSTIHNRNYQDPQKFSNIRELLR